MQTRRFWWLFWLCGLFGSYFSVAQGVAVPDSLTLRTPDPKEIEQLKSEIPLPIIKPTPPSPSLWENIFEAIDWILQNMLGSDGKRAFWKMAPLVIFSLLMLYLLWRMARMDRTGLFYGVGTPSGVGKMMDIASLGQINFKTEIQNAEQKRRYRDAVRWHYLQLLHHLEEQELILWKPEKTNADYASELKGKPFLPAFRETTRHFEYVWYGEYSPDEMAYRHIVASFEALSHLNHKLT